jgi:Beta-1,3-glucanase
MKKINLLFCFILFNGILGSQNLSGYYPIKIINNPDKSPNVTHTYFILMGQDWTAAANNCVLRLSYSAQRKAQIASLVPINGQTNSRQYTYPIDSLQGYDPQTQSITIYIPHLQSGRCEISLNYALYMPPIQDPVAKTWSLQAPSISNVSDPNYDIIYDKFEFSFDTTKTTGCLYINPTAVDFFSIPIQMQIGTNTSGANPTTTRDQFITQMQTTITANDKSPNQTWSTLLVKDKSGKTTLRLATPYLTTAFDSFYLDPQSGNKFNYINALTQYYTNNTVQVSCAELNQKGFEVFDKYKQTPMQNPGAYLFTGQIVNGNQWVFQNTPGGTLSVMKCIINMDSLNTENFFGPGTGQFATPNKTVRSVIVKNISAAFTAGLLPAPNGTLINSVYLNNAVHPFYQNNPNLNAPAGTGPWYNLYTQAVHSAIPIIYAFAYDDVLGQDGTLTSRDSTKPVILTIGNMGNIIIPKHYFSLPVYAVSPNYNSGFQLKTIGSAQFYVDTVKWIVPQNQPATASYLLMPTSGGASYVCNIDSLIKYQIGNLASSEQTWGVLQIPVSQFSSPAPAQVYMQVFTCGGPGCPATYSNLTTNFQCVQGSQPIAPAGLVTKPVNAVSVTYNSGFQMIVNGTDTMYTDTVRWNPSGNPPNAQYYFLLAAPSGSSYSMPLDSLLQLQTTAGLFAYNATSGVISIPQSLFGATNAGAIQIQVATCGGPGCSCNPLTSTTLACSPATAPVGPMGQTRKAVKKKKGKKKN